VKNIVLLVVAAALSTGCMPKPRIAMNFPNVPEQLLTNCEDLDILSEDETKLSELLLTVNSNYSKSHQCRAKNESWINWYNEQKTIYNSVTSTARKKKQ
jgi:hypothetical protein